MRSYYKRCKCDYLWRRSGNAVERVLPPRLSQVAVRSHIVFRGLRSSELDDASETAVVFRRGQDRRCGRRELLLERIDLVGCGLTGKRQLYFVQIDDIDCDVVAFENLISDQSHRFAREVFRTHAVGHGGDSNRVFARLLRPLQ